ncbi:unnamed protein product [Heligmosomoides polygyrus]|uniref:7TM_GPCR_Srx domain-containing protein n=1 Tax=Heligmosomoides polygyrus TaxID=6339 RepID=A0A183F436_HELPZ|nr:unnamed protein product [Heligmosomoides polygyrus]
MHLFYFNIPWIIDEKEYNCSSRSLAEWKARGTVGTVDELQGVYFLVTGIIYVTLYSLSLIGMARGKLLHIPCYRLMFFNGFIDITDVFGGSIAVAYLHFVSECV